MDIYLMRHYKVDFEWEKKYSSKGFEMACDDYDRSGIIHQAVALDPSYVKRILISDLVRSHLTYEALDLDLKATNTNLINEVPIAPFINSKIKLPTALWMTIGRIQWYLNIKKQPEIRRETQKKINYLIQELEKDRNDTLIIGHGFYFSQLKRVLKKMNYNGNGKSHYKNGEVIKFSKASG